MRDQAAQTSMGAMHVRTICIAFGGFTRLAAHLARMRCEVHRHPVSLIRSAMVGAGTGRKGLLVQISGCCEGSVAAAEEALAHPDQTTPFR
ncbi:MAG TPA: hypothetical protein VM534_03540 [Thermoanaerobaculia bacterium]|nr:hypothetical protein [Thermoanaerobaculia bacterium]